jgi:hypothetical protein
MYSERLVLHDDTAEARDEQWQLENAVKNVLAKKSAKVKQARIGTGGRGKARSGRVLVVENKRRERHDGPFGMLKAAEEVVSQKTVMQRLIEKNSSRPFEEGSGLASESNWLECWCAMRDISNNKTEDKVQYARRNENRHVDHLRSTRSSIIGRGVILTALVLVDLAMSPEVGDDWEMAATTVDFACKGCTMLGTYYW